MTILRNPSSGRKIAPVIDSMDVQKHIHRSMPEGFHCGVIPCESRPGPATQGLQVQHATSPTAQRATSFVTAKAETQGFAIDSSRILPHTGGMAVSPSALGKVIEAFEENFRSRGELGAAVSVWWDGCEILSSASGWCDRQKSRPWSERTLAPVYSATKVPAASALLLALHRKGLNAATPVREVWPAFPVPHAEFRHLLSHQCGLAALDQRASIFDHRAAVDAIEHQTPAWQLGSGHGYHPRTFGPLVDEPVRRLTGLTLGGFWREMIAQPLGLDFWIGLPEPEWPRVATLYPSRVNDNSLADHFYKQLTTSGTYTRRAFSSPRGLHSIREMNDPEAWSAGLPALGGVGSASALAKFYQALLGAIDGPFPAWIRSAVSQPQISGDDRVLLRKTTFCCGSQRDPITPEGAKLREIYGPSPTAFGHPGAGGSHGMADPSSGVSFAYVMNQMDLDVMPGAKCLNMVNALFSEMEGSYHSVESPTAAAPLISQPPIHH